MALSLRRRPPAPVPAPRIQPIVAAGTKIDVSDAKQIVAYRKRLVTASWQLAAGTFNAVIPDLGFAHDYVRDSLARVRPYPAILSDDPDEGPIPLDDDSAPSGLDPDLCDQLVQRLAPFPAYMGQAALKLDVWGECFVGLIPDDESLEGERCQVLSPREILANGDQWRIKQTPDDSAGLTLDPGTPFWRIWQPDPEFSQLPYSHMVRLNAICEAYLTGLRLIKSFFLSRLATTGKVLAIADEFSLESATQDGHAATEDAGDGEAMTDTFFDDFMAAGAEAILDPESAAAVMNLIVRGPHDLIKDGIQVIDVSRTMEDTMSKLRAELREEIATGVNLPREIVLGIGATNHWNAEEIKQQAWLNHLEPRAYNILASTTTAYYRPALLENDVDPDIVRRCVLWYDPKWFLGEPDRAESADYGYNNFLISGEAWRAAKNFDPDDAPDEEEIDYRILVQQRLNVRTTLRNDPASPDFVPPTIEPTDTPNPDPNPDNNPVDPPEPKEPAGEPGGKTKVPGTPDKTAPAPNAADAPAKKPRAAALEEPLVAAAQPARLDGLGDRLVAIERDLRGRLLEAADSRVGRALEKAGMKIRGKLSTRAAGQTGRQLLKQTETLPAGEVPAFVGRTVVESFGLTDQDLLNGTLADLEAKYRLLVRRAQQAAARAAAQAAGVEPDYEALDARTAPDRDAGWAILAAGIGGLAATALYNPHPSAPDIGEYDGTSIVPPGLIRAALDRAGGATEGNARSVRGADVPQAQSPIEGAQTVPGGATAGPSMMAEFYDQAGLAADGYVWVYGDAPRKEFPPHQDLDGVSFSSMDDDVIANNEDWPPNAFFYPGDHDGCCCDVSLNFIEADQTQPVTEEAAAAESTPIAGGSEDDPRYGTPVGGAIDAWAADWAGTLTPTESEALSYYTTSGYQDLNEALRSGTDLTADQQAMVAAIDSAITKAGDLPDPVTVWRGIDMGPVAPTDILNPVSQEDRTRELVAEWAQQNFPVGASVELGGYQSTSLNVDPALDASLSRKSPGVVFEIDAHAGAYLQPLTQFEDERELLLARDTTYQVTGVEPKVYFERDSGSIVTRAVVHLRQT